MVLGSWARKWKSPPSQKLLPVYIQYGLDPIRHVRYVYKKLYYVYRMHCREYVFRMTLDNIKLYTYNNDKYTEEKYVSYRNRGRYTFSYINGKGVKKQIALTLQLQGFIRGRRPTWANTSFIPLYKPALDKLSRKQQDQLLKTGFVLQVFWQNRQTYKDYGFLKFVTKAIALVAFAQTAASSLAALSKGSTAFFVFLSESIPTVLKQMAMGKAIAFTAKEIGVVEAAVLASIFYQAKLFQDIGMDITDSVLMTGASSISGYSQRELDKIEDLRKKGERLTTYAEKRYNDINELKKKVGMIRDKENLNLFLARTKEIINMDMVLAYNQLLTDPEFILYLERERILNG